jgi:tripeptidyl-peptidase-1
MHFLNFAVVGAFAIGAAAIPTSSRHVLHEKRDAVPKTWVKRDRLDAATTLPVRIGMTQTNLDKGYDLLMEV